MMHINKKLFCFISLGLSLTIPLPTVLLATLPAENVFDIEIEGTNFDSAFIEALYSRTLTGLTLRSVNLKRAQAAVDFERFTHLESLRLLNLTDSQGIKDGTRINRIAHLSPHLESLTLDNIHTLFKLSHKILPRVPTSAITFPNLTRLSAQHCERLKTIKIIAPRLEVLELAGCASLKYVKVMAPNLRKLTLTGCKSLKIEDLYSFPQLEELAIDDIEHISGEQWAAYLKASPKLKKITIQDTVIGRFRQRHPVPFSMRVQYLNFLALTEDPVAQCTLAKKYQEGNGVPQNREKALHLYRCSSAQGYPDAHYELARMYQRREIVFSETEMVLYLYRCASHQDYAEAHKELATMYPREEDIPSHMGEAFRLYKQAAKYEHGGALYELARIYLEAGNKEKARPLYKRAARQGHAEARYDLARMYVTDGNEKEAIHFFQLAAEGGHEGAKMELYIRRQKRVRDDNAQAYTLSPMRHSSPMRPDSRRAARFLGEQETR